MGTDGERRGGKEREGRKGWTLRWRAGERGRARADWWGKKSEKRPKSEQKRRRRVGKGGKNRHIQQAQ